MAWMRWERKSRVNLYRSHEYSHIHNENKLFICKQKEKTIIILYREELLINRCGRTLWKNWDDERDRTVTSG